LKELSVDGEIILKLLLIRWDEMNRINLVQDRDKGLALLKTLMNFRAPHNSGNFLSSSGIISFLGLAP
jgi:hypothetical protein